MDKQQRIFNQVKLELLDAVEANSAGDYGFEIIASVQRNGEYDFDTVSGAYGTLNRDGVIKTSYSGTRRGVLLGESAAQARKELGAALAGETIQA